MQPPLNLPRVTLCVARLQDIPLGLARGLLSEPEHDRAQRIGHRETRLQFMRARGLLRLLLARCTGSSPRSFVLAESGGEGPRLADNPWGLHFNLSHSDEWAAVAVASSPIGIDIERIDPACDWEPVAEMLFHPNEQERLQQTRCEARARTFFEIWTRKEAYLKGIGVGLGGDPSSFDTTCCSGAITHAAEREPGHTWHALPIPAPAGYSAALASPAPTLAIDHVDLATLLGPPPVIRPQPVIPEAEALAEAIGDLPRATPSPQIPALRGRAGARPLRPG